ncbi:MAG: S8 family serine peptidase [Bacteroidota bacterium]
MRNLIILPITGLLILFVKTAIGQSGTSYFYYYKNKKIPLELNTDYAYVVLEPGISSEAHLSNYLLPDVEINKFSQSQVSKTLKTGNSTETRTSEYRAEIKLSKRLSYAEWMQQLKNNPEVTLVAPYFKSETNEKIGLSNYFYVKLRSESDFDLLLKMAEQTGIEIVGQNRFMPRWYTLKCTKNSSYNALQAANLFHETGQFYTSEPELLNDNLIDAAVEDVSLNMDKMEELVPNDDLYGSQWGLNNTGQYGGKIGTDINAEDAWDVTRGDVSVVVAVLDDGIEMNHPDLQKNVSGNGFDAYNGTTPSLVRGNHGTACAGIVAARQNNIGVSGVAPKVKLNSVSVFFGYSGWQVFADGINWAWQNGADVISNSWGASSGSFSSILDDALANALTYGRGGLGTVLVFSSGNANGAVGYPANSISTILAVGSMSPCGERKTPSSCDREYWWGSNFGSQLDVIAPGVLIPTTDRQGSVGYASGDYTTRFNGTSSACPHVAGVAALVLSSNPNLTVEEVSDIIEQSAQKVGNYNYGNKSDRPNGTWNDEVGYGLVDAYAAVQLAQTGQACQDDLVVDKNVSNKATDVQAANQTLTATNVIKKKGSATYSAGNAVLLQSGFHAKNGSLFHAYNGACGSTQSSTKVRVANYSSESGEVVAPEVVPSDLSATVNKELTIYPNPVEGSLFIRSSDAVAYHVSLYSSTGEQLVDIDLKDQLNELDINQFSPGIYFLHLFNTTLGELTIEKVIIR